MCIFVVNQKREYVLFKKIFGNKPQENNRKKIEWTPLTDVNQLKEINSSEKPVLIFKHSTRCGISRMVLRKFEHNFEIEEGKITLYFLDLLAHRELSHKIAEEYDVMHQSPQVLVLKKGKVVAHGSHNGIHSIALEKFV